MIIRLLEGRSCPFLLARCDAPAGVPGSFGRVEVLKFTSADLREKLGIRVADIDAQSAFELATLLTAQTEAKIRKDRLARLVGRRPEMLPCFVGYQEGAGAGTLPFMTDAVPGRWSLFFEPDGRMTLVEWTDRGFVVTNDAELVPLGLAPAIPWSKSLLSGSLGAARRMIGRSRSPTRAVPKEEAR